MKNLKRSQIAASNYHYIKYSLDYFLKSMVDLDQHFIEFYAASPHLSIEDATYSSVVDIRKKLDERDISVCCLTQEQCVYPINIACEDDVIRERSIQTFMRSIEYAELLGAKYCQLVAGRGYYDNPDSDAWKRSVESIHRIVEKAEKYNVVMVLEAATYHTTNVFYNTRLIRKMIDEINSPSFKSMLDTCAVAIEKEDFRECMDLLGKDMMHLHFADGNPTGHFIPGEGNLPLANYLQVLDDCNYKGAIAFEIYNRIYDYKPHEHMEACLKFVNDLIKQ
jgi:protein FrlC